MPYFKLPDEIIINVLQNLPFADILSARLVCKKWAQIISDFTVLRQKYAIHVSSAILNDSNTFVDTFTKSVYKIPTRVRFHNVVVDSDEEKVMELFSKIGSDIEHLTIMLYSELLCSPCSNNWFILAKHTPNLHYFKFRIGPDIKVLRGQVAESVEEYNFRKLKEVYIDCFDGVEDIINTFRHCAQNINSFHINNWIESPNPKISFAVIDLIHNLSLIKLSIIDQHTVLFSVDDLMNILSNQPAIRELQFKLNNIIDLPNFDNLMANVEKLELHSYSTTDNVVIHMPSNLQNLMSLDIKLICSDDPAIVFANIGRNTKMENLQLACRSTGNSGYGYIDQNTLKYLIYNFPNIKKLDLYEYECEASGVPEIVEKLQQLEDLSITLKYPDNEEVVDVLANIEKLNKLSTLTLSSFICDDNFLTSQLRIPALRALHLDYEITENNRITNAGIHGMLNNLIHLEDLRLIGLNNITDEAFVSILDKLVYLNNVFLRCKLLSETMCQELYDALRHRN